MFKIKSTTSTTDPLLGFVRRIRQIEIILLAEKESFDTSKLESTLRPTDLTNQQKKIFLDFWNINKEKVLYLYLSISIYFFVR